MRQITAHIKALLTSTEKRQLLGLLVLDIVVAFADLLSLVLLLLTIQFYAQPGQAFPWRLPALLSPNRNSIEPMAWVLIFFLVKSVLGYLVQRALYRYVYAVASRLSAKQLQLFLSGSFAQYATIDSAVQIKRIGQHPVEFAHYLLLGLHQITIQTVLVLSALVTLLIYQPSLFVLLLALLAPPILVAAYIIKIKTKVARSQTKHSSEKALQHLKEALGGYVESQVYQKQDFFTTRYTGYQQQLNHWLASLHSVQGLSARTVELFAVLGLSVLIATALFTQHQAIGFLTIGAFLTAAYKIMPGVVKILNTSGQMKIYAYTASDLLQATTQQVLAATNNTTSNISSIAFDQVGFHYADKKILQNCSFYLQPGDFVGLHGHSGKGKTTLLNLLLGFAEQDGGSICINNQATTGPQRRQYLPQMAYVKQQPFMLHDTLYKNITLSDAPADAAKLQAALEASGLQALIATLPDGLQTLITENGKNISGGQRQRIAFARALYKDAPVLLLDEPFSELDPTAETLLLQYCKALAAQGKMVLLITHNPQGLAFCNKTLSLHEG